MDNTTPPIKKYIPWFIIVALFCNIMSFSYYYISGSINENLAIAWWNPNREVTEELQEDLREEKYYKDTEGLSENDYYQDYKKNYSNVDEMNIEQSSLERAMKLILTSLLLLTMCFIVLAAWKKSKNFILFAAIGMIVMFALDISIIILLLNILLLLYYAWLDLENQDMSGSKSEARNRDLKLVYLYVHTCLFFYVDMYYSATDILEYINAIVAIGLIILLRYAFKKNNYKIIIWVIIVIALKAVLIITISNIQGTINNMSLLSLMFANIVADPVMIIAMIAYFQAKKLKIETPVINTKYEPIVTTKWFVLGSKRKIIIYSILLILILPVLISIINLIIY